jgi:hypothetical protein
MITLSRPGFDVKDDSNDNFIVVNVVKNNMGPVRSYDLYWNGRSGQIRELMEEERMELNSLREQKKQADELNRSSSGFGF